MTWLDTRTWQTVRTMVADSNSVSVERVSPDGRLWAQGTLAGAVRWLNAETGGLLAATSAAHRHPVGGLAFSADSTRAASVAQDGTVALWDPSSLRLIVLFQRSHERSPRSDVLAGWPAVGYRWRRPSGCQALGHGNLPRPYNTLGTGFRLLFCGLLPRWKIADCVQLGRSPPPLARPVVGGDRGRGKTERVL